MNLDNLPVEWSVSQLTKMIASEGLISDGDWIESKDQDEKGDIRLIQLADIGDGDFRDKSNRYMNQDAFDRLNCVELKANDVLIARMPDPLGRACIFPKLPYKCVTVVDVCLIRTGERSAISPKLLKYWINSTQIRNLIALNATGTTRKRITRKKLESFDFPVPPLAEQQEIVRQLDVMLAQVEQIKARLDAIPTILKKFRQSVLADAVSGKLTEEWREQEKIKPQIKELQDLKDSLIKSKEIKKDLEVIGAETLFEIPENWGNLALQSFASKITDGEHSTPKRESAGHYLLSARNVRDGYIDVSNVDYVGIEEFSKLRKRCDPNKGDVLISCSGSVGRIALVDKDDEYVMVRSAALVKTLDSFIDNKFLMYVLQSPYLQKQIDEKSKSTAQSNLFLGQIKELSIPYPSLKEQKEIVQQVESLFKNASLIETAVQSAQKRVNLLTQSILAKAFSGELTAEWREQHQDLITGVNSAEALLVKIQAEREASKPAKKTRKNKEV